MEQLTTKQQRVYAFIRDTIISRHTPPTRAEIADALGFASPNAAQAHLRTLARKGVIELDSRRSRGIQLVDNEDRESPITDNTAQSLAVIGRVAAGAPLLAVENVERYCSVDPGCFSRPADYLLRVTGDSMIGAGIFDGDLLAVARQSVLRPGQIAIFRRDDEVTVKRYAREGALVRLVAENPAYPDIEVDTEREALDVEGLVVGVIRSL